MSIWWKTLLIIMAAVLVLGVVDSWRERIISFAANDTTPPEVSNLQILDVSTSSVTIQWETDEEADSVVNYGLTKHYGLARDPIFSEVHRIIISDLAPGTTHYFQISSSDPSGNQGISRGYQFTTKRKITGKIEGLEEIPSEEERARVEEAYEAMGKITLPESLAFLADRLEELAEKLMEPPKIIGNPDLEIGTDYVVIKWVTDKESNSMVSIASEEYYDPYAEDPYDWSQGEPGEMVLDHQVRIRGLEPATTYHYQVSSKGEVGPAGVSGDLTFTTKSPLPEIYNINLVKVQEESATLAWTTNVPCSSLVEYTDLNNKQAKSEGNPALVRDHTLQLTNLRLGVSYSAIIIAEDELGKQATSEPLIFTTVKDESPPLISKIEVESALYPEAETKIQTIINWDVDELSICQVFYQEGLTPGSEVQSFPKDKEYRTDHIQVSTVFAPATVYKFWIECEDRSENKARSEDFTLLTPQQEKSILDIIIENFEQTFSWVKKVKF